MTGTPERASATADGARRPSPAHDHLTTSTPEALLEQAKGVLIFRYSIDAEAAHALIQLWAAEAGVPPEALCRALVHEIIRRDSAPADQQLVRWLDDRLRRHEFTAPRVEADAVTVRWAVDATGSPLDGVVVAAREAARRHVPLELTVEHAPAEQDHAGKAQLMQRIDHALELARQAAPRLEIRLPLENPFGHGADEQRHGA